MNTSHGYTQLMIACELGGDVGQLLQGDINYKNDKGETALFMAVKKGELGLVERLVCAGSDVHTRNNVRNIQAGQNLAFIASWNDCAEVLQFLLRQGVDLNKQDNRKWTPLMASCYWGHVSIVQALLSAGADTEMRDCVFSI